MLAEETYTLWAEKLAHWGERNDGKLEQIGGVRFSTVRHIYFSLVAKLSGGKLCGGVVDARYLDEAPYRDKNRKMEGWRNIKIDRGASGRSGQQQIGARLSSKTDWSRINLFFQRRRHLVCPDVTTSKRFSRHTNSPINYRAATFLVHNWTARIADQ
jgi:hypothetical protein